MHGTYTANMAIQTCDLLINVGARFDDRLTGNLDYFAPNAKVIHIDIDPAEIGKNVPTEIPIVADAKEALDCFTEQDAPNGNTAAWLESLKYSREQYPLYYEASEERGLLPQQVLELVHRIYKRRCNCYNRRWPASNVDSTIL